MSVAGDGEQCFFGFGHGDVTHQLQIEVREIRQFIGDDDRIDDRGAFNSEGCSYKPATRCVLSGPVVLAHTASLPVSLA